MSNEGGAGACAPPPSYYEAIGQAYSYVDFAPACLKAGGFLRSPLFEKFKYVCSSIYSRFTEIRCFVLPWTDLPKYNNVTKYTVFPSYEME